MNIRSNAVWKISKNAIWSSDTRNWSHGTGCLSIFVAVLHIWASVQIQEFSSGLVKSSNQRVITLCPNSTVGNKCGTQRKFQRERKCKNYITVEVNNKRWRHVEKGLYDYWINCEEDEKFRNVSVETERKRILVYSVHMNEAFITTVTDGTSVIWSRGSWSCVNNWMSRMYGWFALKSRLSVHCVSSMCVTKCFYLLSSITFV